MAGILLCSSDSVLRYPFFNARRSHPSKEEAPQETGTHQPENWAALFQGHAQDAAAQPAQVYAEI